MQFCPLCEHGLSEPEKKELIYWLKVSVKPKDLELRYFHQTAGVCLWSRMKLPVQKKLWDQNHQIYPMLFINVYSSIELLVKWAHKANHYNCMVD